MFISSFASAEEIATKMQNASDAISNATNKTILKATNTTVSVNTKAQEANEEAVQLAQLFNQSFRTTIQNIQSVASDFERLDDDLGNGFAGPFFINEYINDLKTYNNAKKG
ncbi:creatininase [Oceanobacillus kimchii]|uniref:Creatininase n=1 Tax=Oceanobacillus kimchii TaxID=746691 RepID=A0ABQ5TKQ6_9BACI|nr:creatininase [Oceanobacillus kimchii]